MKIISILIGLSLVSLVGCSHDDHLKDLRQTIAKLNASVEQNNKKNSKSDLALIKPIMYAPKTPKALKVKNTSNSLENYSTNELQFVGTVIQNSQVSAYILTPDSTIHQVSVGDTLGNRNGKVTRIGTDSLDVSEQVVINKIPAQQIVTLQLKE